MTGHPVAPLRAQRDLVEAKARAVERDESAMVAASRRFGARLRRDIASPPALLALFAAGAWYGRRRSTGEREDDREDLGSRLGRLTVTLLWAVRLADIAHRAWDARGAASPERRA